MSTEQGMAKGRAVLRHIFRSLRRWGPMRGLCQLQETVKQPSRLSLFQIISLVRVVAVVNVLW